MKDLKLKIPKHNFTLLFRKSKKLNEIRKKYVKIEKHTKYIYMYDSICLNDRCWNTFMWFLKVIVKQINKYIYFGAIYEEKEEENELIANTCLKLLDEMNDFFVWCVCWKTLR